MKAAFIFIRNSSPLLSVRLESRVYIARTTAFRRVAGNILELAFLLAARAGVRSYRRCEQKSAIAALPVSQPAPRTDISAEITRQVHAAALAYLRITHGIILLIWFTESSILPVFRPGKNVICTPDSLNSTRRLEQQNY